MAGVAVSLLLERKRRSVADVFVCTPRDAIKAATLTAYIEMFDFAGLRLDLAFRCVAISFFGLKKADEGWIADACVRSCTSRPSRSRSTASWSSLVGGTGRTTRHHSTGVQVGSPSSFALIAD